MYSIPSVPAFLSGIKHYALVQICGERNIDFEWNIIQETNPVDCDVSMTNLLNTAITRNGYEVIELVSGAGHDAVALSEAGPVAMLFVRCFKGISHNPLENVEVKDVEGAIGVCSLFISDLIKQQKDCKSN